MTTSRRPYPGLTRRDLLRTSSLGFGSLALACMIQAEGTNASESSSRETLDLTERPPHFAPRAKAVIMLMQNGGPSQMDLFDPKPGLTRLAGKTMTVETFQKGNSDKLMATPLTF